MSVPSWVGTQSGRFDIHGATESIWSPEEKLWKDNPDYMHAHPFFERYDRETLLKVLAAFDGGAGVVLPHAVPVRVAQSSGPFRGI